MAEPPDGARHSRVIDPSPAPQWIGRLAGEREIVPHDADRHLSSLECAHRIFLVVAPGIGRTAPQKAKVEHGRAHRLRRIDDDVAVPVAFRRFEKHGAEHRGVGQPIIRKRCASTRNDCSVQTFTRPMKKFHHLLELRRIPRERQHAAIPSLERCGLVLFVKEVFAVPERHGGHVIVGPTGKSISASSGSSDAVLKAACGVDRTETSCFCERVMSAARDRTVQCRVRSSERRTDIVVEKRIHDPLQLQRWQQERTFQHRC